ncbi:uncharacterized protein [Brachionichthys hirsutus]|uniref:uncharacterized protein n=1 Tax=Brachionichthys hirsutus TaxID=412623 RepID=UPI00360527F8
MAAGGMTWTEFAFLAIHHAAEATAVEICEVLLCAGRHGFQKDLPFPFQPAACDPGTDPVQEGPPSGRPSPHFSDETAGITFSSQSGGVGVAVHRRRFKCFDTLPDDLSPKMPLPFGVRAVTTPRGPRTIRHLEQLRDGGCSLCSDRRQAKPIGVQRASNRHSHRPRPPEAPSPTPFRPRRVLLVKNGEPATRKGVMLSQRSAGSLKAFLKEASALMQFHVRDLYTVEGGRVDSWRALLACPGVLVCVGREAFSPTLPSAEEKIPGNGARSPGNGARSPTTPGVGSTRRGSQSRASENIEGHSLLSSVNFGLETKKSVIHPRSDSSSRSTRVSVSPEKSRGGGGGEPRAPPTIATEGVEKRVLVGKDGSLSLEMRVRFRLRSDETLQWKTRVKKSPSRTHCCPLSHARPRRLQQGQSESCSDSASFDPEGVDYSERPPPSLSAGFRCPCCCQRREQPDDSWDNPVHRQRRCPVPPTQAEGRDAPSSSSSSSCHSRRVVRCRARLSKCRGRSGDSQLVRQETCVTEQVEVDRDGHAHVEVRRVSRCCSRSEVVGQTEDELMVEAGGDRSLSAVSSSSNVLQSLKEDPGDDLSFSASQCRICNEASPYPKVASGVPASGVPASGVPASGVPASGVPASGVPASGVPASSVRTTEPEPHEDGGRRAVSSCPHGPATPHSVAEAKEMDRVSCGSNRARRQTSEGEDGEIKTVVCPKCGASQADQSHRASPKPAAPLPTHRNVPSAPSRKSNASPDIRRSEEAEWDVGGDGALGPSVWFSLVVASPNDNTAVEEHDGSPRSAPSDRPGGVLSASAVSNVSHGPTCYPFDATCEPAIKVTGQEEGIQAGEGAESTEAPERFVNVPL